jgi:hypothetical protein
MLRIRAVLVATTVATAVALVSPGAATASPAPSDPIASGFAGPLQMDVTDHGIYVAQDFAGILTKVRSNGTTKDLVSDPGTEIAGVAADPDGYNVVYTQVSESASGDPVALLKRRFANGTIRTIANLGRFEQRTNPDGAVEYGFRHLSKSCADQFPADFTPSYSGIVESHPYAVANAPGGGWYVADAAANDILYVSLSGHIEVVKVIRPVKVIATEQLAEANGMPDCVVGKRYNFEPVPTDVEVNRQGYLIVSLLPGGPEDGSAGANGQILRIDPVDGEFSNIVWGLSGATNLATGPGFQIYVSELYGQRISVVKQHVATPVAAVTDPGALEFYDGKLYAGVNVFGDGSIVTLTP